MTNNLKPRLASLALALAVSAGVLGPAAGASAREARPTVSVTAQAGTTAVQHATATTAPAAAPAAAGAEKAPASSTTDAAKRGKWGEALKAIKKLLKKLPTKKLKAGIKAAKKGKAAVKAWYKSLSWKWRATLWIAMKIAGDSAWDALIHVLLSWTK
ncbi:hypothetical protein [Actinocorallia longicatena]|uniref:Uncharacterized protein n=1 Tax=Actinocorallia longicatena TaxID=111803 RepID=A0ABP6QJ50_9ACTN